MRLEDFSVINGSEGCREHISLEEFHAMGIGTNFGGRVDGLFEFVKD